MSHFRTVTGADFARSIAWAKKQPPNPITQALRHHLMTATIPKIQNAINAAESVAHPTARNDVPVTVSNETLLLLIEAAKRCVDYECDSN